MPAVPAAGQAAKACNNMLLAINMIGISEAFNLSDALGLERKTLFDIVSTASGGSWALPNYAGPELVPTTPANNNFNPGFTGAMMLKDLKLGQDAAQSWMFPRRSARRQPCFSACTATKATMRTIFRASYVCFAARRSIETGQVPVWDKGLETDE